MGLFFFIRASIKERTQQITFSVETSQESLLEQLKTYFEKRAYQVINLDPQKQQITYQGFVRPSWFLAIFLSILAAIGLLCLALVLSLLYPFLSPLIFLVILSAPGAGWFYWQKAGRLEQVLLNVKADTNSKQNLVTIIAHRDELIQLQQSLSLKPVE